MFWKAENLILQIFWFCGLFHVSIVDFQVDLCQEVWFACVISELGGRLPDLGWFLFYHHFEDNCHFELSNSGIGYMYREPFHRTTNWWGHEQKKHILVHLAFAWVTIELWGALPDLAWFFFLHHFKDECQARLLSYQAPESGTGNPLNEPRTEEVVSQRSGVQFWTSDFWFMTSSNCGS